jgi:hypothetical protein
MTTGANRPGAAWPMIEKSPGRNARKRSTSTVELECLSHKSLNHREPPSTHTGYEVSDQPEARDAMQQNLHYFRGCGPHGQCYADDAAGQPVEWQNISAVEARVT